MLVKKKSKVMILIAIIFITSFLQFNTTEVSSKEIEGETIYKNLTLTKMEGNTIIVSSNKILDSIRSIKWRNENIIRFNHVNETTKSISNMIYDFDIAKDSLKKMYDINGSIWGYNIVNDEKGIIYSKHGFNGLYYKEFNGKEVQITTKQNWYKISPNGNQIIISGVAKESTNENMKRYIYDIPKNKLTEVKDIPSMNYVFSDIAAKWSPNSVHIASQKKSNKNQINIINSSDKIIEKEIKINNDLISDSKWSPGGNKLAFLIQSEEYEDYIIDDVERNYYMSDKVGIYDVNSKEIKVIDLKGRFTTKQFMWSKNSQGIIIQSVKKDDVNQLVELDNKSNKDIEGKLQYIDINNEAIKEILKDKIFIKNGYPVHKIRPIELFENNLLIYADEDKGLKTIDIMDLGDRKTVSNDIGFLYKYYKNDDNIYMISDRGIYIVDEKLTLKNIMNFNSYYKDDALNVEAQLSPDFKKVALNIEFKEHTSKNSYIEIKDL